MQFGSRCAQDWPFHEQESVAAAAMQLSLSVNQHVVSPHLPVAETLQSGRAMQSVADKSTGHGLTWHALPWTVEIHRHLPSAPQAS